MEHLPQIQMQKMNPKEVKKYPPIFNGSHRDLKRFHSLLGKGTPNQNLACYVPYLKIISTFVINNMYLEANCVRNSKLVLKFL